MASYGERAMRSARRAMLVVGALLCVMGPFADGARAQLPVAADAAVPQVNGPVSAIAVADNFVILGGSFTKVGGQTRRGIAAIDRETGALIQGFNPGVDGPVYALASTPGTVVVGGEFTQIGGQPRRNIARLRLDDGSVIPSFNPNAGGPVNALAADSSTVLVGGQFGVIGRQGRRYVAQLNLADGLATAFDAHADGPVLALVLTGSTVITGGSFRSMGGQPRSNIAQVKLADGTATQYNPGADDTVRGLAVQNGILYLAGHFNTVGGLPRHQFAQTSLFNGGVSPFSPHGLRFARAVAVLGTTSVIVSGGSVDRETASHLAQFDIDGSPTTWNPVVLGQGATHQALTTDLDGRLYVGCDCSQIGGRNTSFARFTDPASWAKWGGTKAQVLAGARGVKVSWKILSRGDLRGFTVKRVRRGRTTAVHKRLIKVVKQRGRYAIVDPAGRQGDRYVVHTVHRAGQRIKRPHVAAKR